MNSEPKIVSVEACGPIVDLGADAAKAMPPGRRHRYTRLAKYTLEDGSTHESEARGLTKPKLAENIDRDQRYAQSGHLFASLRDGQFRGKITRISINY